MKSVTVYFRSFDSVWIVHISRYHWRSPPHQLYHIFVRWGCQDHRAESEQDNFCWITEFKNIIGEHGLNQNCEYTSRHDVWTFWIMEFILKTQNKKITDHPSGSAPLISASGLQWPGGRFKNTYELLNQRTLKFSYVNKIHIFQCMGKIFCVEFQRYPLKFHTKYLTHTFYAILKF